MNDISKWHMRKPIKQNPHNPTLKSVGVMGAFNPETPIQIYRDELSYNKQKNYKDTLQKTIEHIDKQTRKRQHYQQAEMEFIRRGQQVKQDPYRQSTRIQKTKSEMADKITMMSPVIQQRNEAHINYQDTRAIRYKQYTGYNIISNH